MKTFHLPDLGEGLPDAEIHEWYVKVGDTVKTDDRLASVETAKALVDVPAPFGGKVAILHANVGDIVKTGAPLISFESDDERADTGTVVGSLESRPEILEENMKIIKSRAASVPVKAPPIVKALANRLGVDITAIKGTGRDGMITAQDVQTAASTLPLKAGFQPLKGARRAMFTIMSRARDEISELTVFDDADISAWPEHADYSARLVRALTVAAKAEPMLNASLDAATESFQQHVNVNIGIAMDTEDGLFVPVLQNADQLSLDEIRQHIEALKHEVQSHEATPQLFHGATISLSNIGVFSGRYATPIIVPPQVAILACGSKRLDAIVKNGAITSCPRLPLSLSFDHRAVTGGEATRFLRALMEDLEKPQ